MMLFSGRLDRPVLRAVAGVGAIACATAAASMASAQTVSTMEQSQEARIRALEEELKAVEAKLAAVEASQAASSNASLHRAGAASTGAQTADVQTAGVQSSGPAPDRAAQTARRAIFGGSRTARAGGSAPTPGDTPSSAASALNPGAPSTSVAQRGDEGSGPLIPSGTPTSAATASIVGGRPVIQSGDGQFTASLLGVMQFDAADYDQATPGSPTSDFRRGATAGDTAHARDLSSGTDFRRARIGLAGKVFGDFEYDILYEFGGAGEEDAGHVQELWVQYSGLRPFHFRVGAFAPFIGLEDAGSTNGMPFLERPAPSDIARSLAGGDYREGAQLVANTDRWFASAAVTGRLVGVVNSTASGISQPYDSQLGWIGRLAAVPFEGSDYLVHVGVHGSFVEHPADTGGPDATATTARYPLELRERPELRVDGTRLIDTGSIDAEHGYTVGGEFAAEWRSLFLQGEYDQVGIERRNSPLSNPSFPGWYVEGTWLLTGESRKYNTGNFAFDGPPVKHNFRPQDGHWGAFELGLRYSDEDLNYHAGSAGSAIPADGIRGGDQKIITAGLNWYLNPVVRFMFDYQYVDINRLSPSATTFSTPIGAEIGQNYHTYSVRSQFAF